MDLPERQLDNWIDTYLEYTNNSEPPTQFHKWTAISCIAACLQRRCYTVWDSNIYPNMYIVLTAPSGCRKGTAMKIGKELLQELNIPLVPDLITREALIKLMAENEQVIMQEGKANRVHSSYTLHSEELAVFLGKPGSKGDDANFMMALTNWYDCADVWGYETKNAGSYSIYGVFFNLLGATTPVLIESCLPIDAVGSGFTGRIVFVYADRKAKKVPNPTRTPTEALLREQLLQDLRLIMQMTGEFEKTNDYQDAYNAWYEEEEDERHILGRDVNFIGYMDRRATHIRKLSMIMSAAKSNDMVLTKVDFKEALDSLSFVEKFMPGIYQLNGKSPYAAISREMLGIIAIEGKISYSELCRRFYKDMHPAEIERNINAFDKMGVIRILHTTKDGGPWLLSNMKQEEKA